MAGFAADSTRPNSDAGPTEIFASIVIVDFDSVRDADQSFEASVFFRLSWKDPRLKGEDFTSFSPRSSGIWIPQVGIANQQNSWSVIPPMLRVEDDGTVTISRHIWGAFSQPLNLLRFPFDSQMFRITLLAASEPGELRFLPDPEEPSGIASSISVPDWSFSVEDAAGEVYYISENIPPADSFVLKIRGDRLSQFYIYTMILPLFVITAMSFVAFYIEPGNFATRLGVASTSMLTVITYRVAAGQILPRTSYFTDLDIFIAGSTGLVFVALLIVVGSKLISDAKIEIDARTIDRWSRIVMPGAFAVLAFVAFA